MSQSQISADRRRLDSTATHRHKPLLGDKSGQYYDAKRLRQATRVAEIYQQRRSEGAKHVAVLGDLNDGWENAPPKPLRDTDLRDVSVHPSSSPTTDPAHTPTGPRVKDRLRPALPRAL